MFFFSFQLQLRADAKFNLIVTRILAQYINFRARKTAANKLLGKEQVLEICQEIWQQIDSFVGSNFVQVIMILLRTDPKDYKLDVVLYPLFDKTHELVLRQQRQTFPEILIIILAVLFYKHWLQMCTRKEDKEMHTNKALTSLRKNFERMPEKVDKKFIGFIRRVDDRFYQTYRYNRYKRTIWYDNFHISFSFDVQFFID